MKTVHVCCLCTMICLVAVGEMSAGKHSLLCDWIPAANLFDRTCSVPFVGGHFDDCSARYTHIHIDNHFPFSSVAEIYFNDSIKVLACRLFSDLDFNSINFPNSWPNITDTCIQQSPDGIAMLYHTTPSGPGRSLTAAQCQTYEQIAQCRMDCLLTFELSVGSMELFGYIHLRAISCNETLFTTSIGNIFNNQNNIQPIFTARQSVESKILSLPFSVSMTVPMSSATIVSIHLPLSCFSCSSSTNLSTIYN